MSIAGQTFTVIQDAGVFDCQYAIAPSSRTLSASGGAGAVSVTAESRCAWAATSDVEWITITSGGIGVGSGAVNYSVAPNTTGLSRKGRITIGGQVFNVKQK
jgi:hypothetical protein